MANTDIMIRAEARKLFQKTGDKRLSEYKKMPSADLKALIDKINSGAKGTAKGPAAKGAKVSKGAATTKSTNGSKKGAATKGARKGSVKSAPAGKSAKPSTKGAKGEAKRPTTTASTKGKATVAKGAKGTAKAQSSAKPNGKVKKAVANKAVATVARKVKGKFKIAKDYDGTTVMASNGRGRVTRSPKRGEEGFRAPLDREAVDWTAPWNGGQRGSRAIVLEALREHEGDYVAVFKALKRRAAKMYANVSKPIGGTVETHLKWHIARTAFDFAIGTGQHEPGVRAGYGESKKPAAKKSTPKKAASPKKSSAKKQSTKTTRKPSNKGKATRKPVAKKTGKTKGRAKKGR